MCGICGYALTENRDGFNEQLVSKMVKVLRHRGPDACGSYVKGQVAFGHARLSIIDLEGGAQPMLSEDETIVLTFNGEIYNYKELKADLAARGHIFVTESDTEVIIHLYQEYGEQFLEHLNGMFAIGLWDESRQQLLLARDRLGEKPLYYAHVSKGIIFASELKAFRQVPELNLRVDMRALDNYLAYGYVPSPDSIYDAVKKLPHAHCLTWKNGSTRIYRYWELSKTQEIGSFEQRRAVRRGASAVEARPDPGGCPQRERATGRPRAKVPSVSPRGALGRSSELNVRNISYVQIN